MKLNSGLTKSTSQSTLPRPKATIQIVIAWTEKSAEFVEQVYIGGGEHKNVFKDVTVPKACMWLNDGKQSDIAKAHEYIVKQFDDRPGAKVLTYQGESNPLVSAKRDILKTAPVSQSAI